MYGKACYEIVFSSMTIFLNRRSHGLFIRYICSDCLGAGQCYSVNASSWLGPTYLVEPIYGAIMPVLLTVTLIFNTIIILVLTRPHMVTATNTVLLGMAVCDLMTVLLPAPSYIYYYSLGAKSNIQSSKKKTYGTFIALFFSKVITNFRIGHQLRVSYLSSVLRLCHRSTFSIYM